MDNSPLQIFSTIHVNTGFLTCFNLFPLLTPYISRVPICEKYNEILFFRGLLWALIGQNEMTSQLAADLAFIFRAVFCVIFNYLSCNKSYLLQKLRNYLVLI